MHFVPLVGALIPLGSATGGRGDTMDARYSWQWMPLEIGLGAKIIDELYIGGYMNFGLGYEGSDERTSAHCNAGNDAIDDVSCSSFSFRAGLEVRYSFTPDDTINPWLGYGFGFTSASQYISDAGRYAETSTAQGLELARITGGLDFRLKRGFGLGPYAMVSLGRYTHERTEINNVSVSSADIASPAVHGWLAFGLRLVAYP
jgi:hypothetical protein